MDSCRTLCLLSLLAVGCTDDVATDTGGGEGFYVVSSIPEQGATDVAGKANLEFLLSQPADPEACNDSQFVLAATDESGEKAYSKRIYIGKPKPSQNQCPLQNPMFCHF